MLLRQFLSPSLVQLDNFQLFRVCQQYLKIHTWPGLLHLPLFSKIYSMLSLLTVPHPINNNISRISARLKNKPTVKTWGVMLGNKLRKPVASVPKLIRDPIGSKPLEMEDCLIWVKWIELKKMDYHADARQINSF